MKKIFLLVVVSTVLLLSFSGCNKAELNTSPGLYLVTKTIRAYPTGLVSIQGEASDDVGIESITIQHEALMIYKRYDLEAQTPKVFPFHYVFNLGAEAQFIDPDVMVTVTDVDGKQTSKAIRFELSSETF